MTTEVDDTDTAASDVRSTLSRMHCKRISVEAQSLSKARRLKMQLGFPPVTAVREAARAMTDGELAIYLGWVRDILNVLEEERESRAGA